MISNSRPTLKSPTVTVILTTYNHARFLREALNSILIQETTFDYEVVIIDDYSTDGTRDILFEYKDRHPEKIRLVLSPVNKCNNAEFIRAIQESTSSYIAILDGDDYWTSSAKLQKQVDYLDQHTDCTICFHNVRLLYEADDREQNVNPVNQKATSTLEDLLEGCFITTCSAMFRSTALGVVPAWYTNDKCADWSLFIFLAQNGQIGYIDEVMAVYRQHAEGFWSGRSRTEQLQRVVEFYDNLYSYLPAHYSEIRRLLARSCFDLALECERQGDTDAAQQMIEKCLSVEPDLRKTLWWLRTAGETVAQLLFPEDDASGLRIDIRKAVGTSFDIQLNQSNLKLKANNQYAINFRARADEARGIQVGCAQSHEPWNGLGLYREIQLTSEWQDFEERFVATADEDNARIHFDVGECNGLIDLSAVELLALTDGEPTSSRVASLATTVTGSFHNVPQPSGTF